MTECINMALLGFLLLLPSSLFAQSANPPVASPDGVQVLEQSVRNPALTPLYVTEPDGTSVRELGISRDVSYDAFLRTIISYLDGESPSDPRRTPAQWNEILTPASPEVARTLTLLNVAASKTSGRNLSFSEYQAQILNERNRLLINPNEIKESTAPETLFSLNFNNSNVLAAEKRLVSPLKASVLKSLSRQQISDRQSAAFLIDPISVIIGMKMLQDTIDKALDRADEIATSQLFALREHLAVSIQDMNVLFKDRLNQTFDKLSDLEQKALNSAMQLSYDTQTALDDLETKGFEHASDLLCQAAVAAAQLNVLPIFKPRPPPPDLLCITTPYIRDSGTLHERFISFRGVSLRKGGYPEATLVVPTPEKRFDLPAAGGNTIIQMPLPGGINGGTGDISPRGSLTALAEFNWNAPNKDKPKLKLRWMFTIEPYLVNSIDVSITPKIRQATYAYKAQRFYVDAGQTDTNTATWALPVDNGGETVDCWYEVTTKDGNSGITNEPFRTTGGCVITAIARGQGRFKGGGNFGIILHIKEKFENEIAGPTWKEIKHIVNQPQKEVVFTYDKLLTPADAKIIDFDFDWRVDIHRNTEQDFMLTTSNKEDKRIGIATMDLNGNLTVKFAEK
jgi:hypothetical protein